jgi:hypothetical protein
MERNAGERREGDKVKKGARDKVQNNYFPRD